MMRQRPAQKAGGATTTGDALRDRYRGCLLGTAVGDALGAPAEFLSLEAIRVRYGPHGVSRLEAWDGFPAGSFTDDTQLTLATAEGLLQAEAERRAGLSHDVVEAVRTRYILWHDAQADPRQRRHPGATCMSALRAAKDGHRGAAANWSKGCGGVMRMAPAGLASTGRSPFELGVELAALTHGHPSGFLTAGFLAHLVARLATGERLHVAVNAGLDSLAGWTEHEESSAAILRAVHLVDQVGIGDEEGIRLLGEGWVAEEALAIALFCALRYSSDWRAGVLAAANHDGDCDSTGAITGAILGVSLGVGAIPPDWAHGVEEGARILQLADSLWRVHVSQSAREAPCG